MRDESKKKIDEERKRVRKEKMILDRALKDSKASVKGRYYTGVYFFIKGGEEK